MIPGRRPPKDHPSGSDAWEQCVRQHRSCGLKARRAKKKLQHAIAYLSEEALREGSLVTPHDSWIEACAILMNCNRQVYFQSPDGPSFDHRIRSVYSFVISQWPQLWNGLIGSFLYPVRSVYRLRLVAGLRRERETAKT